MTFKKGKHIILRPLEINDLDILSEWENDPDNMLLGNNLTPFSRFFLEQFILGSKNNIYEDRQLRLVIENREIEVVGLIDLFDFDPHHKRAAVGILVGKGYRGRGYADEALDLLVEYADGVLGLKQLYSAVDAGNQPSKALFQKKGFVLTGTRKQWNLRGRTWEDEDFLQLVFGPRKNVL
jgi:diamine N-acetyltransferase